MVTLQVGQDAVRPLASPVVTSTRRVVRSAAGAAVRRSRRWVESMKVGGSALTSVPRTWLGRRRRRSHHRATARTILRQALATFEMLGAEPWAEQARSELRATGVRPAPNPDASLTTLTPQELQVALIVAGGATNNEAATALFISPKTVEFHLSHVYGKLGVRGRTELVRKVAGLA